MRRSVRAPPASFRGTSLVFLILSQIAEFFELKERVAKAAGDVLC